MAMMRGTLAMLTAVALVGSVRADAKSYFSETEKDFGVTALGPVLVHYFPIKNKTNSVVQIGQPRIQCGCVGVLLMKATLQPGETTYMVASMMTAKIPTTQIGIPKSVTVNVPFLSPVLEEVTTKVTVLARPDMVWSTTDGLALGTVAEGKTATGSMKITLYGNDKWEISKTEGTGKYIKAEAKAISRTTSETTYEITATVDASCPAGSWMSEVFITTNATGVARMRIPLAVVVAIPISANPGALDLGSVGVGSENTRDVLLTGLQPFRVLDATTGDAGITAKPQTEGSKNQHTVKVTVKPTKAGTIARELNIKTDSKEMPTLKLAITATVK